jgi:transposase-like protein
MDEILNVDFHRRRLLLKSLNISKTYEEAAKRCGIAKRTLFLWKRNYNIRKNKEGKYVIN